MHIPRSLRVFRPAVPALVRTLGLLCVLSMPGLAVAQNGGLDWLTFVGGSGNEEVGWPNALHVDGSGAVWVGGADGATAPTALVVARLSASGQILSHWTIPTNGVSRVHVITTDASGTRLFVAGRTTATNLPVTSDAVQLAPAGGADMFVLVLDAAAPAPTVRYATYLGGAADDVPSDCELDGQGGVWLYGSTASTDFPVTANALQPSYGGGSSDAVVCRIVPGVAGRGGLTYSSFFGGSDADGSSDLERDGNGVLSLAGGTASTNLLTTARAFLPAYGGGARDGFLAQLDVTQTGSAQRLYTTYVGWAGDDNANAMAVRGGIVTVGGWTQSSNLPTNVPGLPPAVQAGHGGRNDGFLLQIDLGRAGASALRYCTYLGGIYDEGVNDLVLDAAGNVTLFAQTGSPNYPTTAGSYQQTATSNFARGCVSQIDPIVGRLVYSSLLWDASGAVQGLVARGDGLGGVYVLGRTTATSLGGSTRSTGDWDLYLARWSLLPHGAGRCGRSTPLPAGSSFISVSGHPASGSPAFAITAGGAPDSPGSVGVLIAGFPPCRMWYLPPIGVTLYVQPLITIAVVVPQNGARAAVPVPLLGIAGGASATFQFVWYEPQRAAWGATNALEVVVQ